MVGSSLAPFTSMTQDNASGKKGIFMALSSMLLGFGIGCVSIWSFGGERHLAVQDPSVTMALAPLKLGLALSETRAAHAAGAALRHVPLSRRAGEAKNFMSALNFAARDGFKAGCRGNRVCARAVGLFWSTQSGKTEEVAGMIASAAGIEAKEISEASVADLAGYDGLIVGTPTWNTGADEQRSGTAWDDLLEEIRGTDLCGKPVAVFGTGDSVSYGDNFCDAIEELHSTFAAAGAKMLGPVDSSGYEHSESKSDQGGKFLGLPCDQDNEDDKTEGRVKAWVTQLKSEGMPL